MKFELRPSQERGGADYGWLKSFHSFSVPGFPAPVDSFGALQVINEDRVEPSKGFGLHGHREMEIFSYLVSGELHHKDSMGNVETLKRGDIQMTSAGTGIRHSEYNGSDEEQVHFLQIWAVPSQSSLSPKYFTRNFPDSDKVDNLLKVVAPVGSEGVKEERESAGPAPVHSQVTVYATIVSAAKAVIHTLPDGTGVQRAYIQIPQSSGYNRSTARGSRMRLNNDLEIAEGDGVFVWGQPGEQIRMENIGETPAEALLFDLA
ncbi:hypothetical protein M407DRAFT_77373 [Tulasnella calospora MUT 4182]|uniref:Pirin N-terminal domain-containing protein n=1 Tax=Tulasnella calospora MUT 4182 TaxID=1051891 RepID=A0A0C3KRR2_9AGAM|nr:hypothetical protein M407DRAFT_77373 [Tulasnella calospora MUT 4182]